MKLIAWSNFLGRIRCHKTLNSNGSNITHEWIPVITNTCNDNQICPVWNCSWKPSLLYLLERKLAVSGQGGCTNVFTDSERLSRAVALRAGNGAVGGEARQRGAVSGRGSCYQGGVHVCLVHNHISEQKKNSFIKTC